MFAIVVRDENSMRNYRVEIISLIQPDNSVHVLSLKVRHHHRSN